MENDFLRGKKILIVEDDKVSELLITRELRKFSREILKDLIIKKFPKFAVRFSETNTNPINYF